MTEQEFWGFLKVRGRAQMLAGSIDSADPDIQRTQNYLAGHTLLPRDFEHISEEDIIDIGCLLFQAGLIQRTKEAVLVLLAHQRSETALTIITRYNLRPDKGLEFFAKFALEECLIWNE